VTPRARALPARLVLATGNAGKLREIRAILAPWGVEVRPQSEFTRAAAEETGLSFVENAILKARFAAEASGLLRSRTTPVSRSMPCTVRPASIRPGTRVRARTMPPTTTACCATSSRCPTRSAARAIAARWSTCAGARSGTARLPGKLEGRIGRLPRGRGGFGYDPLFLVDEGAQTAAELEAAHKNEVSHRGRALRALVAELVGDAP